MEFENYCFAKTLIKKTEYNTDRGFLIPRLVTREGAGEPSHPLEKFSSPRPWKKCWT